MADETERKTRGAFYGRRMGHPLRKGQAAIMREALPSLALDLAKPAPADLRTLFPDNVSAVRLEIGFGGGENLLFEAQANPGIGHIGCDVYLNGVAQFVAAASAAKLPNIRVHHGDAQPSSTGCRKRASIASTFSIPIRGRSGGIGSDASFPSIASRKSPASSSRAARCASPPTFPIMPSGRSFACCARARSSGPPSGRATGWNRGPAFPARAMKPKPCARAGNRPISALFASDS